MKPISKFMIWLLLSSLLAFGAKAQEAPGTQQVKASRALICGSAENAKTFVTQNQDLERALSTADDSAGAHSACLVAPIAYIEGKQIDRVERGDGAYAVTEIMIVGVATPVGMLAIEPSVVYTIIRVHEEAA